MQCASLEVLRPAFEEGGASGECDRVGLFILEYVILM